MFLSPLHNRWELSATAIAAAMASPMVDGRVEPHRKATYTLDISDEIRREDRSGSGFSSVKCTYSLP